MLILLKKSTTCIMSLVAGTKNILLFGISNIVANALLQRVDPDVLSPGLCSIPLKLLWAVNMSTDETSILFK